MDNIKQMCPCAFLCVRIWRPEATCWW